MITQIKKQITQIHYAVVIAGGAGKRLWPRSRGCLPKYLLKVRGDKTLLEETIDSLKALVVNNNILIMTNKKNVHLVSKKLPGLPKKNIIAEPVSRNTSAAVCIAAMIVKKRDPDGIIFVLPADQITEEKKRIRQIFKFASSVVGINESLLTIGLKPTYAATGFGYIKTGALYKKSVSGTNYNAYKVDRFVEKPSFKNAQRFYKSKRYLWNSGLFIGRAKTFLEEFRRYQPGIYKIAKKIEKGIGTRRQNSLMARYYKAFPDISIDYSIMEKTERAYVIKADISWQDAGSWLSFEKYLKKDSRGNSVVGDYIGIDSKGSIVIGEKRHLVAILGLDNIILIHTPDITLVCAKERAEDVKGLVELVQRRGLNKYL